MRQHRKIHGIIKGQTKELLKTPVSVPPILKKNLITPPPTLNSKSSLIVKSPSTIVSSFY